MKSQWRRASENLDVLGCGDGSIARANVTAGGLWAAEIRVGREGWAVGFLPMSEGRVAAVTALRAMIAKVAVELGGVVTWEDDGEADE